MNNNKGVPMDNFKVKPEFWDLMRNADQELVTTVCGLNHEFVTSDDGRCNCLKCGADGNA